MVWEYHVFNGDEEYVETVYMTEQEFKIYFDESDHAIYYNKHEASSIWQK